MNTQSPSSRLILVRGIYDAGQLPGSQIHEERNRSFTQHGQSLGVRAFEWVDGRSKGMANKLLRRMRGTGHPVNAIEILSIDESKLCASLESDAGSAQWREFGDCASPGYDVERSFILMGRPRQLLDGNTRGQRLFWFGNGIEHLSRSDFIEHYTNRHGPLVAGYGQIIGLRNYLQFADEQIELCDALRDLGLGQAAPPAVFAQLIMGAPRLTLPAWRARRKATREIEADEKRHINFETSMLLLADSKEWRQG